MKNLIILSLATLSLAACKKHHTTLPSQTLYVYGRAINAAGIPQANLPFEVVWAGNRVDSGTLFWVSPGKSFTTDAHGNFNFIMNKPQQNILLDIWLYPDSSAFNSQFFIMQPVGDSLNLNDLTMQKIK